MSTCLKINDISCYYGSHRVIEDLSYDFPQGSFVGIIGPNGSGKSTLLNALSRTLKPKKGIVYLGKEDVYKVAPKEVAKTIGVVPQNTMVNFSFTAHEVVMMGRNPYLSRFGWENDNDLEIVRKAMEATGTSALKDKYISDLSGGERQRVIISRALAQEPEILLLDEPTSHLDITHQLEILQLLYELNKNKNITVVIVIHDLNLAAQYCKDLILLKEGKIFATGPVSEVITKENVTFVYNTPVIVNKHPLWDVPNVTLLPRKSKDDSFKALASGKRIHLICGGGSGKDLIKGLVDKDYRLSIGVLNQLDLDWEEAKEHAVIIIEEKPFSSISEQSNRGNLEKILEADLTVLADVPVGHGNLKNLESALVAQELGKEILILGGTSFENRDFVSGQAKVILETLVKNGAKIISKHDFWSFL